MQAVLSHRSRWACVALILGAVSLSGCGRAGPTAAKALASGERAGARTVGRNTVKAEQAVAKGGWKKEAGEVVREKAIGYAKDQAIDWAMSQGRQDEPAPARFPNPSAVRPLPGTRPAFDASTGLYSQPNDYGGFSFFQRDGKAAGFSVLHRASGQLHAFDPSGNPLR